MKKLFFTLIILCSFSLNALSISMNIDPSNIKFLIKPGDTKTGEIFIQNTSSEPVKLKIYAEDWIYLPDGSKNFMKPGSTVYSCTKWLKIDQDKLEMNAKETKKISFSVTSPKNATGGHVSVIFFESVSEVKNGILVAGRIGTIIYLDTEGDIKRSAEIKDITTFVSGESSPIKVNFTFVNKGNTYINAPAIVSITKDDKVVIEKTLLPLKTLPSDRITGEALFQEGLKEGNYDARIEVKFDDKTLVEKTGFSIKK